MKPRIVNIDAKKFVKEVNAEIQADPEMLEIQKEQAAKALELFEEVISEGENFVFEKKLDTVDILVDIVDQSRVRRGPKEDNDKLVHATELLIKSFRRPQKITGVMHKELRPEAKPGV